MSMINNLVNRLRAESKSMGKYGTDYMATLLMDASDTIIMLSEKARADRPTGKWIDMNGFDSLYPPKNNEIYINGNGTVIMNLETLHSLCQDDSPLRKQIMDKHQVEYAIAKLIRERRK